MLMPVRACKLVGRSACHPSCGGDWLAVYKERLATVGLRDYVNQSLDNLCPRCRRNQVAVGVLVAFFSWENRRAYIVPLCRACAGCRGSLIELPEDLMCVPLPAESVGRYRLRYPASARAFLRSQYPLETVEWDGTVEK